jgi:transcriptional regulator with XRE-family HTH domain
MEKYMFSERLKMLQDEKDWTQEELAAKAGMTNVTICRYESGARTNPWLSELIKLCGIFNVSLDFLVGLSNERYPLNKKDIDEVFIALNDDNKKKVIEYSKFVLNNQKVEK